MRVVIKNLNSMSRNERNVYLIFQMQRSNGNTMVLDRVDFINSGAYSCEVIADQTFHTLIETKHMLVIGK